MIGVLLTILTLTRDASAPCVSVTGERITMRDLAAADTRFAAANPDQPVGFAPHPGAKRVFWPYELSQSATRAGLPVTEPFAAICFERQTRTIKAEDVVAAIRAWAPPEAEIEVLEQSHAAAPVGELTISRPQTIRTANDGSVTLRGFVQFDSNRRFPVWARVRLSVKQTVVVAAEAILPGAEIREDQLRMEERKGGIEATESLATFDRVIGRTARKRIGTGEVISRSWLNEPEQVKRGAIVSIEVRDGATHLSLEARAETNGRTGDNITVRNPSSGKSFQARVTGENAAEVFPRGVHHLEKN